MNELDMAKAGFGTRAIHYSQESDPTTGAVIPPISLSTTFEQSLDNKTLRGFEYSRSGNPNRDALEKALANLEGGKHGFAFSSGLSAQAMLFSLYHPGSHVIIMNDTYGGSLRYLSQIASKHGIETTMIDLTNPKNIEGNLRESTVVVWLETPTNPTLKVVDIAAVVKIVKKYNKDVVVVVDNTLMSPYFQKPLLYGADLVSHSVTKYINGHSDVVMGALITSNDELAATLRYHQNAIGAVPSAFDCFLAHRGLKTLHLRMKACEKSALAVAKLLKSSSKVKEVNYTGLKSHAQHATALKQQTGFGGLLSFTLNCGMKGTRQFLGSLVLFRYAESLGGIESLIEIPSIMTHAAVPKEVRESLGIVDSFIRMSIGIEDTEDLIKDVQNALDAITE